MLETVRSNDSDIREIYPQNKINSVLRITCKIYDKKPDIMQFRTPYPTSARRPLPTVFRRGVVVGNLKKGNNAQ